MSFPQDWAEWQVTVPCETCATARGSIARFSIELTVRSLGKYRGQTWLVCSGCLSSCVEAAYAQHLNRFGPLLVKPLPAEVLEYT